MLSVLVALYTLGLRRGRTMDALMKDLGRSVGAVAMILLVIAAGGALSQVLRDGGVAQWVTARAAGLQWNPLLLAFGVAALLRLAVGSATVAGMTTAGLVGPLVAAGGVRPELMVLATGAGSLMFSHFNDTGFWMFKEYFGLGIRDTFATWSVMEVIVALVGLGAALAMQALG
jgi:Gnt-I system high-affinity gluconate transporter/Gnt-II system L-idonate transporter